MTDPALSDRPRETDIECGICGAFVAAFENEMCCHCRTVEWVMHDTRTPSISGQEVVTEEVDWVATAATLTLERVDFPPPVRSAQGKGLEHAAWLLGEVIAGRVTGRKAHRWLGYAQAALVEADWLTLDEAKNANKEASDSLAAMVSAVSLGDLPDE